MAFGLAGALAWTACGPAPAPAPTKVDKEAEPGKPEGLVLPQPAAAPELVDPEIVGVPLMEIDDTEGLYWLRPPEETTGCIAQWSLGSPNVLDELRKHGAVDDFPKTYPAKVFEPPKRFEAMEALASKDVDDTPYLWRDVEENVAVVDARAFGDLTIADATRLPEGESATIGTLTTDGHKDLYPRAVLAFLLESRALATWAHIGSELCLTSERSEPGRYVAVVKGTHTYFTNEKNEDPLRFEFSIEADASMQIKTLAPE